jgi:WD40 repeat protein
MLRDVALAVVCVSVLVSSMARTADDASKREEDGAEWPVTATSEGGKVTVAVNRDSTTLVCLDNTGKKPPARIKPEVPNPVLLALTPDGSVAVLGGEGGQLAVIRLHPKPAVLSRFRLQTWLQGLAISPNGKIVAAGGLKSPVVLINTTSGKAIGTLTKRDKDEEAYAKYLPQIRNARDGEAPPAFESAITALCFSPDGKKVAAGFEDGKCRLWALDTGKPLWEAAPHKDEVTCLAFFPCGKYLVSGSMDCKVNVAEAATGKSRDSYLAHGKTVCNVAVSPDGRRVASCGLDRRLHIWDAENEKSFEVVKVGFAVPFAAFSKDHVFVGEGTALRLFDLKTKKLSDLRKPK